MRNEEIIERAANTTAQLANGGKLNPEQSNKFIDYVFDESVLKGIGRLVKFRAEQRVIDKIGVGRRVALPKEEATDPVVRRLVSTSQVTLQPRDIVTPFEIGDLFIRHNIEGDGGVDHVIKLMATQTSNNIDELWINGNQPMMARLESEIFDDASTTNYIGDAFLNLFDGFLKQGDGANVVDLENAPIGSSVFNKMLLAMPTKFRRNRKMLKYFVSPDHEQAYREWYAQRQTGGADIALNNENNLTPFGSEMVPLPLLERDPLYAEDSVANSDGTTATQLSHQPIASGSLVLTPTNLPTKPDTGISAYVLDTDYTVDETNGTWTRLTAGAIGAGATVRATYRTGGKLFMTMPNNLLLAIGLDIRIEKARQIYKGVWEYAIHTSVDCKFEELTAVVLGKNMQDPTL
jgi:hypothetical protein